MSVDAIKFGTDGWRGVIGAEFTFDRLLMVAPIAAEVLADTYSAKTGNRKIIVGFDRRFMAETFATRMAEALRLAGFDVILSDSYAPTPAFSWAAHSQNALGALVITASHNPGDYLGLKVKGNFGGSVSPEITQQIEARLGQTLPPTEPGSLTTFDPWDSYCQELRGKVDLASIQQAIESGKLTVFADAMHGAASTGLDRLLGTPITELNSNTDPLFDGGAPEPLPKYLSQLMRVIRSHNAEPGVRVGLVFDGDCDRIAAVDGSGEFLSSQILIPILIEHLVKRRGFTGEIIKTVSTSNLVPRIARLYNLPVYETPIGYKYIADRMLDTPVLIGGEESGGIGYGNHIPERDALLSALYILEAIAKSQQDLGDLYRQLETQTNYDFKYDRVDLHLASMDVKSKLVAQLETQPFAKIANIEVRDRNLADGYKFNLSDDSWLLIRFSGTEPVLRLYCEAATIDRVHQTLAWAQDWANSVS
ncbi:phosphoglucomutase/phosphomannomutase family protein [Chamaesiphon sp. GL140_3_metabinner_50]|uniref:phosphoglucomutase/phosphomannomutase family protein n=1 Tax=Chamaesiphon sp. GL140_3_metabinner_50 TaxID=2970812 RepID=UPI0025F9D322|nr:phosphoglucomutase/phosphomannomutase family protein [Chamaesiphon sp. GL140_3_metabinner_50]